MSHASPPLAPSRTLTDPLIGGDADEALDFVSHAQDSAVPSDVGSVAPSMLEPIGDAPVDPAAGTAIQPQTDKVLAADDAEAFSKRLTAGTTATAPPSAPRWLGKRVGRFKLVALVGRGSWGKVFEAEDTALKRRVALKLLATAQTGGGKPVDLPRLLSEARAAAALDHPHATQIYEVGQSKDLFYIAMELAEGGSLDDVLNALGALDPIRACRLAAEAADALSLGHELGITHRDVKPGNLLLSRSGRCKVADFGLATIDDPADPCHFTRFAGTAYYVAPEIVRGERADARSDIYSLGATLFHLLGGSRPFEGSRSEVLKAHLKTAPPDLHSLRSGLDPQLVAIIEKAMAKDPNDRFESAAMMARALRYFTVPLTDDTRAAPGAGAGEARPPEPSAEVATPPATLDFAKRHAKPLLAAAGIAVAGLVIATAALMSGPEAASASAERTAEPAPQGRSTPADAAAWHRFELDARDWGQKPSSVHVVGDFNGWTPNATPLHDPKGEHIWTGDVKLAVGNQPYKFVIDANRWINDPAGDPSQRVEDGRGGHSSAVTITAKGRATGG